LGNHLLKALGELLLQLLLHTPGHPQGCQVWQVIQQGSQALGW
jgi:hypothetical protein